MCGFEQAAIGRAQSIELDPAAGLQRQLCHAGLLVEPRRVLAALDDASRQAIDGVVAAGVPVLAAQPRQLGHHHQRRQRVVVIVQGTLPARHFQRQAAVVLDVIDALLEGGMTGLPQGRVIGGQAGGQHAQTAPVVVVVAAPFRVVPVGQIGACQLLQPRIDARALLRVGLVMHFQVGHGHRIEHPLPHVERLVVVDPDHLPEHRAVLRPSAEPGQRALRSGAITIAQVVVTHARHVGGIAVQRRGGVMILLLKRRVDHRAGLVGVVAQGADVGLAGRWWRAGGEGTGAGQQRGQQCKTE